MKTSVSVYDFRDSFRRCGRQNQFSYEGLQVLFDYLEEYEESAGEEIELDVIALCCEYAESTFEELAEAYDFDIDEDDEDERLEALSQWLCERTQVCGITDSKTIVYQQF